MTGNSVITSVMLTFLHKINAICSIRRSSFHFRHHLVALSWHIEAQAWKPHPRGWRHPVTCRHPAAFKWKKYFCEPVACDCVCFVRCHERFASTRKLLLLLHQKRFICLRSILRCFFSLTSCCCSGCAVNQGPRMFTQSSCPALAGANSQSSQK